MITSTANETIKQIRKLRDRKFRDESSSAYVEGIRIVVEAVDKTVEIERIIVAESFATAPKHSEILDQILKKNLEITNVSDEVFRSLSLKDRPQGISAVVKQHWISIEQINQQLNGLWVCLWEVADPGNLGTILRTMDAVDAKGLILAGNCTDPYDPSAIRASMGAIFSKTLVKSNLEQVVNLIEQSHIFTVGTADSASENYRDIQYRRDMMLVMGSERQGLPQELGSLCNEVVALPMLGSCDSLNLAVATGVILYEILNQVQNR